MMLGADLTAIHTADASRASAPQTTSDLRVIFLTNLIAPYWKSVLDSLAPRYRQFRLLVSARIEANRSWGVNWHGLDVVLQKTLTMNRRWRHPKGFSEPLYVHLPLDTFPQLRRFRPDVVISNEMGFRTLMALLYRKCYPASRLLIWADVAEYTEQGRGRIRHLVRRFLQKNVDGFFVLGESGARYLHTLGTPNTKISRVPYTTDVARFAACPLLRPVDRAHRLLYVGQFIERKGLVPFIDALSQWAAAHPARTIDFVLAGDGPLRDTVQRLSHPSNLELTFLGSIAYSDLPRTYAEAGILAFPTLADNWGLVVNEALASGAPVLGSLYSQAVESLVEDNCTGWIFRPDVPDDMYAAIDRALNTGAEDLNRMREAARSRALELTPVRVASRIDDVVRRVARVS